jgi:hypothetical protein
MQKEVHKKKSDVIDSSVTAGGAWRYTPVRIRNLCMRSLAMGLYFMTVAGLPTVLILWAALGSSGVWHGYNYTIFKGLWAAIIAVPVCFLVFFAAVDTRNFPELEFESLMLASGKSRRGVADWAGGNTPGGGVDDEPIPLVGNVSHV